MDGSFTVQRRERKKGGEIRSELSAPIFSGAWKDAESSELSLASIKFLSLLELTDTWQLYGWFQTIADINTLRAAFAKGHARFINCRMNGRSSLHFRGQQNDVLIWGNLYIFWDCNANKQIIFVHSNWGRSLLLAGNEVSLTDTPLGIFDTLQQYFMMAPQVVKPEPLFQLRSNEVSLMDRPLWNFDTS